MKTQLLEWDSIFFKMKIGKLDTTGITEAVLEKEFEILKQNTPPFDLIYIFCDPKNTKLNLLVSINGGILYDEKITYVKPIDQNSIVEENHKIISIEQGKITDDTIDIAIQSGEHSRFKIDPRFKEESFKELYKIWIANSVDRKIAFETLALTEKEEIAAIITLGEKNHRGDIGLFAVDKNFRGKGIGQTLIQNALIHFSKKAFSEVQVVTQKKNKGACSFYEKNNFTIESVVNIYHIWS